MQKLSEYFYPISLEEFNARLSPASQANRRGTREEQLAKINKAKAKRLRRQKKRLARL